MGDLNSRDVFIENPRRYQLVEVQDFCQPISFNPLLFQQHCAALI